MDYDKAMAWCAELRSGKHTQTKGVLHEVETDAKCCLGVACAMWASAADLSVFTSTDVVSQSGSKRTRQVYRYNSEEYMLSDALCLFMGVNAEGESGKINHVLMAYQDDVVERQRSLADLNDEGFTFAQIADVIEFFWDCI